MQTTSKRYQGYALDIFGRLIVWPEPPGSTEAVGKRPIVTDAENQFLRSLATYTLTWPIL
jgi:hypothetical protein